MIKAEYMRMFIRTALFLCVLVLGVFTFSKFASSQFTANQNNHMRVEKGVLTAPDWIFLEGKLSLTGDWEVIWGELVEPVEFDQKHKGDYFKIPGIWNDVDRPEMHGAYGVATFRLKLKLPQYNKSLSYHIVSPNSAWRFYVDGVYAGGNGVVTTDPDEFRSHYVSRSFSAHDADSVIVLQVANFSHANGGPEYAITLWDEFKLVKMLHSMSFGYVLALGTLLSIGLIHLIFYLADRNRQEQSATHLWFSLLCFVLVMRIFGVIPFFHIYAPESIYWSDLNIAYISLFSAPSIYLLFFKSAFPQQFPKKITRYIIWLGLVMSVFVLVMPEHIYTQTKNFSIGLNVFVILYSLFFTALAYKEKQGGAGAILGANFLFFLTAVHDAYIYTNNGNALDLTPFGFMLLGLGYSYALLLRLQQTFYRARRTSEALEKLNLKLEEQVAERTRAFKAAAAKAENSAHEKAEFIAAASHDLRQPLHALAMFNLAIKQQISDPALSVLVEKEGIAINSLGTLLQDTLDAAKSDTLQRTPEFKDFDVPDFFDKILTGFEIQAENKNIKLSKNIDKAHIVSDPVMLQRILSNLIENALKAAKSRVNIGAKSDASGWVFSVTDDGSGIRQNDINKIFESYVSLDEQGPTERGGYGLGLYVVNEFTKVLGGTIKVAATSQTGSTFVLTIPHSPLAAQTIQTSNDPVHMPKPGTKILSIDDEPSILEAMQALLTSWKCHIETANDLEQALGHLSSGFVPDLLIVDYHLQDTDGLSVIKTIRKKFNANVPAIIVTGATESAILEKIKTAGFEVLSKPIDPHLLSVVLRKTAG